MVLTSWPFQVFIPGTVGGGGGGVANAWVTARCVGQCSMLLTWSYLHVGRDGHSDVDLSACD